MELKGASTQVPLCLQQLHLALKASLTSGKPVATQADSKPHTHAGRGYQGAAGGAPAAYGKHLQSCLAQMAASGAWCPEGAALLTPGLPTWHIRH